MTFGLRNRDIAMAGRRITHILDSTKPQAGSVSCVLPGLFEAQRLRGWDAVVISRENIDQAERAVAQADLVHVHGLKDPICSVVWPILKASRKRYILSTYALKMPRPNIRSPWLERWLPWTRENRLIRNAWCLHALAEPESEYLKKNRHHRRVKVLPLGVDPPVAGPTRGGGAERQLLFLGPLHPGEGLIAFLKACAFLADEFRDLRLVLGGPEDPRWTDMIRAATRRQGFEDRVSLIVAPDADRMNELLAEALLLAAPNPGHCCPVSPLQALVRAKPVLISPGCNLPEVQLRRAGWVVDAKSKDLRRALHEALSQRPSELADMGRRGQQIIEERYSWQRLAPEYLNLYARAMQ